MLNALTVYEEAGRKAGVASRRHDTACSEFHSRWARSAIALEQQEDKAAARKAFDDAYRLAATPKMALG